MDQKRVKNHDFGSFWTFFDHFLDPLCQDPPNHHKYDISSSYWTGILDTIYPIIPIPPKTPKTRQKGVKKGSKTGFGTPKTVILTTISGGPSKMTLFWTIFCSIFKKTQKNHFFWRDPEKRIFGLTKSRWFGNRFWPEFACLKKSKRSKTKPVLKQFNG